MEKLSTNSNGARAKQQWRQRHGIDSLETTYTDSGIPVDVLYTAADLPEMVTVPCDEGDSPFPGETPFLRGVHPNMYRGRLWTMRQYAGFGSAEESNRRYRDMLERGQTGLSVALDLPTQMGYDSDHPLVQQEVGRVGVAIDTLADMERLFQDIPLDKISTNFTVNGVAPVILAMYAVVAEKQGVPADRVAGTVQNDLIKEAIARKAIILPIRDSVRIAGDIIEFCGNSLPRFNPISISGYHVRELGANAIQELGLTLLAATVYANEVMRRPNSSWQFLRQISFQLSAQQDLFEEVAKFRAARRMWARIVRDELRISDEKAQRFRVFSGGNAVTLTAREPLNNIIRGTLQCLAAVLGGAQAIHVPAYDEAYDIPSEEAALLSLRVQQIIAYESGVARTVDPLGGSYFIENLTSTLEDRVREFMQELEAEGGLLANVENGRIQQLIYQQAYELELRKDRGEHVVVGVNRFQSNIADEKSIRLHEADEAVREHQVEMLKRVRAERDEGLVRKTLAGVEEAARERANVMPSVIEAVKAYATVGEITDRLVTVYGRFEDPYRG